jgi:hypothetical protein
MVYGMHLGAGSQMGTLKLKLFLSISLCVIPCLFIRVYIFKCAQEFFSAGVGFILYAAILLRVRGNLYQADDKWRLRFVPAGEGWKLSIGRDMLDSAMLKAAQHMVWYVSLIMFYFHKILTCDYRYPVSSVFNLLKKLRLNIIKGCVYDYTGTNLPCTPRGVHGWERT